MKKAEEKKLRRRMEALAKQHGAILCEELIAMVFYQMEECQRQGEYLELIGATSGEGFFEFDLKVHKVQ